MSKTARQPTGELDVVAIANEELTIFIRPKESIMLSDRFMLFAPIELKFFSRRLMPP